jgi:hypothetical protein
LNKELHVFVINPSGQQKKGSSCGTGTDLLNPWQWSPLLQSLEHIKLATPAHIDLGANTLRHRQICHHPCACRPCLPWWSPSTPPPSPNTMWQSPGHGRACRGHGRAIHRR